MQYFFLKCNEVKILRCMNWICSISTLCLLSAVFYLIKCTFYPWITFSYSSFLAPIFWLLNKVSWTLKGLNCDSDVHHIRQKAVWEPQVGHPRLHSFINQLARLNDWYFNQTPLLWHTHALASWIQQRCPIVVFSFVEMQQWMLIVK